MAQRLVDFYHVGDEVEVLFTIEEETQWRGARVRALEHPGVWVQTTDRRLWFVTNGKRIRPVTPGPRPEAS